MAQDSNHHMTIMPKKLAQALMEAGVHHFAAGGGIGGMISQVTGGNNNFQAQPANLDTQNFSEPLAGQAMQQQATYNNQSNLAGQLMAQSQGQGPNPAQAQLNQTTAQNIQNQGAMMASQRGASSNPALLARQVAMQGAQTQQQAVGQSATMNAQQQLAAQQEQAQVLNNMGGQSNQAMSITQGALAAQNASEVSSQLGDQGINAQIAGQNAATNTSNFGALLSGGGSMLSLSKGGMVPNKETHSLMPKKLADALMEAGVKHFDDGGPEGIASFASASAPQQSPQSQPDKKGGLLSNIFSNGGEVQKMADGGMTSYSSAPMYNVPQLNSTAPHMGGMSSGTAKTIGQSYKKWFGSPGTEENADELGVSQASADVNSGALDGPNMAGGAGDVGEIAPLGGAAADAGAAGGTLALGADAAGADAAGAGALALLAASKGGQIPFSQALLNGGSVPGKAKVKGDSKENDTEPTLLSAGEVVIPRSITMAPDAPARAAKFIEHLQSKKSGKPGFGKVIEAKRMCNGGYR